MTFAQIFREYRITNSITQQELAKFLGYGSSQFISNIERGISHPPKKDLKKLCKKYGWDYFALADLVVQEKCQRIQKEWIQKI